MSEQIADRDETMAAPPRPMRFTDQGGAEVRPAGLLQNRFVWAAAVCVLGIILYVWYSGVRAREAAAKAAAAAAHRSVPVSATAAKQGDLNLYVSAIGTVTAFNTVTVKSRVDGQIVKILFKEGQMVHQGDVLIQIDPRPYQVQLTEAEGQMARDKANLVNAQVLLDRDQQLFAQNIIAKQDLDNQRASVGTYAGTVKNDQGLIDSAKLNLTYSTITSPINGRIGLRLVDIGNIVHATDTTGLVVITQLQPIAVDFSIPEDDLPRVTNAMKNLAEASGSAVMVSTGGELPGASAAAATHNGLPVEAYDRDFKTKLAMGFLLTTDNQIDQTTGTIKLKAQFPNNDSTLFPNQFVNVRLLVDTQREATLIPTAAIQRSSQGSFVYVVQQDQTVAMRPVKVANTQGEITSVASGVQPGELVVVDGTDKLRTGSRVAVQLAANPTTPGATQ
ncbi:MAG TPA: efflux RND transporter periplasmic adaptor subunit [Candidatus Binataceae bacterium]|nr:efflux RND transporter periplasmic adaptor subunit [Candidatus Binataceae bacterium]